MAFLFRSSRSLTSRTCVYQRRYYAVRANIDGPMPRDAVLREGSVSYPFSTEYQRVKAYNQISLETNSIAENPVVWNYAKKVLTTKTIPELEARLKQLKASETKLKSDDTAGKLSLAKEKRRVAATVAAILRLDAVRYVNEHGIRSIMAKPAEVSKRYEVIEADTVKALEELDASAAQSVLKSF